MTDTPSHAATRRKKIGLIILALIAIGAVIAAGLTIRGGGLPKRFAVVAPGVLYRCSQPKTAQLDKLADDYGIKTLVIAREGDGERVAEEMEFAKKRGLRVVHIPIESRKPLTAEQIAQFFTCVDDPACRPVLVHCSAGRHRTGYLCGLFRIERQGWTVEQAVQEMLSFGAAEGGSHPLIDFLRQYQPGTAGGTSTKPAQANK
jgi:tyrosine-protein phosphatase SIW14